jgi:diguanylate cyclase (GGDEF)-like protein
LRRWNEGILKKPFSGLFFTNLPVFRRWYECFRFGRSKAGKVFMSLRQKVLSILLAAVVLYGAAEYALHHRLVFPEFLRLEEQQAIQDLQRVRRAFEKEIRHLDEVCRDWAAWDDMYGFVESRDPRFIASNLVLPTFLDNRINIIYLFDRQGGLVWGEAHETTGGRPLALVLFEQPVLPEILACPEVVPSGESPVDVGISGILPTEQGPMLLSVRPVLTSENRGPMRGTLVMGRLLDASLAADLAEQTRLDFFVGQPELSVEGKAFRLDPDGDFPQFDKSADDRLFTYQPYPDLSGKPAFLIRVESPRTLIGTLRLMMRHVVFSLVVAGLVLLVLLSTLLQRIVLGPVSRLTEHARAIRTVGDLSARIHLRRSDEIGQLSCEFDGMMAEIEQKTSEIARANCELQRLSHEDMLTRLANRRKFEECLSQEWQRMFRERRPLSLILCDLDFFKLFNDTYGHQEGDRCLKLVAGALLENSRRPTDLVARFGGEEFAIVLADTEMAGALAVAEAVRGAVRLLKIPHQSSTIDPYVTLSAGVATLVPEAELAPDILVSLADQALYCAKQQGRNRVKTQELATASGYQPPLWFTS